MKKFFALSFSMALICTAFTGCGNDRDNSSNSSLVTERTTTSKIPATNNTNDNDIIITETVTDRIKDTHDNDGDGIIDGMESAGEDIIDGVGDAAEDIMDGITGDNSTGTTRER
ncbi:MAG: hypothetical protein K2G63_03310 [Oscillospiraceae bacterium]|nr:hypothetical protein [Oscillospiraceae bacterium]